MSSPAKVAACDLGYEEIFALLDDWSRDPSKLNEVALRPMLGGIHAKLLSNGRVVSEGRGRTSDEALANALEALGEAS